MIFADTIQAPVLSSRTFITRNGKKGTISIVLDPAEIDQAAACALLQHSFINEYKQYLHPQEIDAKLQYWYVKDGVFSVEAYYSEYFSKEFENLRQGRLHWLQAIIDNKLVGWATYTRDAIPTNALYMDLLIVDPAYSKQGIGAELVYAVKRLSVVPDLKFVNLLLRSKNRGGRIFYEKLGFKQNLDFQCDNFVDLALLKGWTLEF
jgi:ribosomal protein S18 acetylase RimI-like enzyme